MKDERSSGERRAGDPNAALSLVWWWRWIIPSVSFICGGCLLGWPFVKGLTVAADDVQTLLTPMADLWSGLALAWRGPLFRPAVVVSSFLVDPATRSAPLVAVVQGTGLVVGAVAVFRIADKWASRDGLRWGALALWLLHPSVAVSAWQTDTVSQTFSAAAGLWLFALATEAWRPAHRTAWWLSIVAVGLLTKETFLGWVPVSLLWARHTGRKWEKVHGFVLSLVAVYLLLRLPIALSAPEQVGTRYALRLDLTLFTSVATVALGLFTYGPLHLLRLIAPTSALWWLALLGPLLHLVLHLVSLQPFGSGGRQRLRETAMLWGTALLALVPVTLLGHVSELYLMGPNALAALALAHSWRSGCRWPRLRAAAAGLFLTVALWGVVSRAYHFALTWQYSGVLAEQLTTRTASGIGDSEPSSTRDGDPRCEVPVRQHSVYFVNPLHALCVPCTEAVARARGAALPEGWERTLDCGRLTARETW